MTAQTRTSNKSATFTAYYAKKAPKQIYFPHRRKVVRERPGTWDRVAREPGQVTFLPEEMRVRKTVEDSEGEDEVDEEELSTVEAAPEVDVSVKKSAKGRKKDKKRSSEVMQQESDEDEDLDAIRPAQKRRRQLAKNSKPRSPVTRSGSASGRKDSVPNSSASPSKSEAEEDRKSRTLRRQSTMTQLIDGRRPSAGDREPEFRPVRRRTSRTSWGSSKGKDAKQRTLTQMVPGLAIADTFDDETDEEIQGDDALAEHITESGIFEPAAEKRSKAATGQRSGPEEAEAEETLLPAAHISVTAASGIDAGDEDDEAEYQPTQFIPAPTVRRRQTPRWIPSKDYQESPASTGMASTPRKASKSRFGLLATPERRKICEIPSSQSPPDSPLSTQFTPGNYRSPLVERSGNDRRVEDTPSKRKKVAFNDVIETVELQPASRRKFASQIPDSEDEGDDLEDEDNDEDMELDEGQHIGVETQRLISGMDYLARSRNVGAETQALIDHIDQACANDKEDGIPNDRESSEGTDGEDVEAAHHEESQELGVQCDHPDVEHEEASPKPQASLGSAPTHMEPEIREETQPTLPLLTAQLEPSLPTTPVLTEHTLIEEDDSHPTTPHLATLSEQDLSLDPDDEPIQVARSPPPQKSETQETMQSHSSKAEQQLQYESMTYSQFPPISSHFPSLPLSPGLPGLPGPQDHTTSVAPAVLPMAPPHWSAPHLSQATTVDYTPHYTQRSPYTTPKKLRVASTNVTPKGSRIASTNVTPKGSRIASTNTTPHRIPNSQPLTSPQRPDTLVIPSSYPSPSKGGYADWSSPVLGRSELGSLEDFSIPPLPPMDDYTYEEEVEL